jgi:uncharacterized protein (DUF1800 family)
MLLAGRWNRVCKPFGWNSPAASNSSIRGCMRAMLAFCLCVLMVDQPLLMATVVKRGPTAGGQQTKGEGRVLHALNRLTFGPRPGDVAAVEAMGLSTWFDMQLNPAKIDDSALDARLAMFPAMQLRQTDLMARYPSQQMIRQLAQRNGYLPGDPVERAIYGDELAFYQVQKAKQAAGKETAAANGASDAMAGDSMASGTSAAGAASMAGGTSPAPAPIERRAPRATSPGAASPVSGNMAAGSSDDLLATMVGAADSAGNGSAMLPKEEVSDPNQAPDQHVEKLFKDLEAVKIINLPPEERMHKVLAMAPADFVAFRQSLSGGELGQFTQGLSPQQREIFAAMQNSTRMVGAEEMQVRLIRDIYSNRQLEAVMTDFWLNHFNVYVRKNQNEPYLIPAYEREVIRPNALGKFEDLLVATAKSPAMLMYLDNWQSIGADSQAAKQGPKYAAFARNPQVKAALKDRGLNENYGRELMELHTLGVNGGYTQADVTQVAKVFTGWTIAQPAMGGTFQFDERRHEPGSKTVLGKTIRENGMNEGLEVLHMLATSPATARFISTKLAVRFVSDDPPPALIDRMTQSFLASDGDIKAVLQTMFDSPEFWAPPAERSKVKTPLEFVVSAVRASGATVNNTLPLVQALDKLGMPLYGMQTPNGYSWMSDPWVSTGALVSRMNFALVLSGDKLPGVRTDWSKLLNESAASLRPAAMEKPATASPDADPEVAAKERKLEQILLGQPLSEKTRAAVISQSNDTTAAIQAMKEFQVGGGGGKAGGGYGGGIAAEFGLNQRNAGPDDLQAAIMAGLLLGSPEFQRR